MAPTKADLINQVHSSNPKLSKVQAREALKTILKIMRASRVGGDDVLLSGFGKFNSKTKSARKGKSLNWRSSDAGSQEGRCV
jgi:integration host factor subunit alpha